MSGLTPTGFVAETTAAIQTAINAELLTTVDPALDLSAEEPLGQIVGIFASQAANMWALIAAVYQALDPNSAQGAQLDVVCSLTGTVRKAAKSTLVAVTVNLDAGHVFAGARLDANGNVISNGALTANISGHPEYVFTNVTAFDTTAAGGAANYAGNFVCTQTGAVVVNSGVLTVISPSVAGFNSITNATAGTTGSPIETDTQLRLRRVVELTPGGGATMDSMRTSVLEVAGVIQATVLENTSNSTDGNTLPPHSFMVVVWDGSSPAAANNAIAQAIWNGKPSGILSYDDGSGTNGTAIDSTGASHTVGFMRATQVQIWIAVTIVTNSLFPSNGDALVQAALVAFGNALTQGQSVIVEQLKAVVMSVAGVVDITQFKVDTVIPPVATVNITIAATAIARFDTSRVAVTP